MGRMGRMGHRPTLACTAPHKGSTVENPFRPSAGAVPPEIIGREDLLDEFAYGLRLGSGAPGLLAILAGARGMGKTTTLGTAGDIATARGWAVISEVGTPGFMVRIAESMRQLAGPHDAGEAAGQSGAAGQVAWRAVGEDLLRRLAARGVGLVITVDDITSAERAELEYLAAMVQHFIREGLPVGLVLAGTPDAAVVLLDEGPATFLRRADRIDLEPLSVGDVEASFAAVFAAAGFDVAPESLHCAATATEGIPLLVQVVGYCLWGEAEKTGVLPAAAADQTITTALDLYSTAVMEEDSPRHQGGT